MYLTSTEQPKSNPAILTPTTKDCQYVSFGFRGTLEVVQYCTPAAAARGAFWGRASTPPAKARLHRSVEYIVGCDALARLVRLDGSQDGRTDAKSGAAEPYLCLETWERQGIDTGAAPGCYAVVWSSWRGY